MFLRTMSVPDPDATQSRKKATRENRVKKSRLHSADYAMQQELRSMMLARSYNDEQIRNTLLGR